jgi:transcription elongation factor Elf1
MKPRGICPACNQRPVAVNSIKKGVRYYRKMCDICIRADKKMSPKPAAWQLAGYKKKPQCERCGFKFKLPKQSVVFYVDGNLKNNNWVNIKTVCLNCQEEVFNSRLPWKRSPLVPDF